MPILACANLAIGIVSFGGLLLLLPAVPAPAQVTRGAPAVLAPAPARSATELAPAVYAITPAVLHAGNTYEVLVTGSQLNPRSIFSFGDGIETAGAPRSVGEGQLRLTLRVQPGAPPGVRSVRVLTGNLAGQGPATLSIVTAQERRGATPSAASGPAPGAGALLPPPPPLMGPGSSRRPATPPSSEPPLQAGAPPAPGPLSPASPTTAQAFQFAFVKLAFGVIVPDTTQPAWGNTERDFNEQSAQVTLVWEASTPGGAQWRWQIAAQPFAKNAPAQPAGLLGEGDAYPGHFKLDLAAYIPAWVKSAPPAAGGKKAAYPKKGAPAKPDPVVVAKDLPPAVIDSSQTLPTSSAPARLYIRLIAFKDGQPTGTASNAVVATYVPPKPAEEAFAALGEATKNKHEAEMLAKKAEDSFDLRILSFQRAVFPDPNRWGCVVVVANPHANKLHSLGGYPPGEHCPKPNPKYQQKEWFDKYVVGSVESWAFSWNKLSGYYNSAKSWIAGQIAGQLPCHLLGKDLEDECQGAAEIMVGAAISAGLVAAGLPPSLPNLEALSEAAKGKIADAAVEASCQGFESNVQGACTPEVRAQLKKYYKKGLDELQKQLSTHMKHEAREPNCGNPAEADDHGLVPLPCFSDFPDTVVKPAQGSIYEPPVATVRVTRKKAAPVALKGCDNVGVSLYLKNQFEGGYLGGKNLPPAAVAGWAYLPAATALPKLEAGKSVDVKVILGKMAPVDVPGNHVPHFHFDNWKILYWGGKGTLTASLSAATVDTGKPQGTASASCAKGDSWPVQIPQ